MLSLLKNLECFTPDYIGVNDILIADNKIYRIHPNITPCDCLNSIYDLSGFMAFPGIIDQHVHISGGGGEGGFISHIPEIDVNVIISAGISTVAGLLGADSYTQSLESLYSKAKKLETQGITTFIYTGCYQVPPLTFTGDIVKDMFLIDKVIGIGEIAISDHRSSNPSIKDLLKIAADMHLGGLLSGIAGIVHLHIGDGKKGLGMLFDMLEQSDLPIENFIPTHINRSKFVFKQGIEFVNMGGRIDLTSGEQAGLSVPDAIKRLIDAGADLSKVTITSDANASIPGGGVSDIRSLYNDIINCINLGITDTSLAFRFVTENVAKLLKLYPKKGVLREGSDADILVVDKKYQIRKLYCMGKLLFDSF